MTGEIRIGVFICHCGKNIGGVVDVPAVAEYAATLEGVVYAEHNLYTCAEDGLAAIRQAIVDKELNRVVVASCTPRTHAQLFQKNCEEAGLNKYLFEFVNIREHCSWVHMKEKEKATKKACDLVRMGVARARMLRPEEDIEVPVTTRAMVIGGGVAGMSAALGIAEGGVDVVLVEKEDMLGGLVRGMNKLWPNDTPVSDIIENLETRVRDSSRIRVMKSSRLEEVEGFVGNFRAKISGNGHGEEIAEEEIGAIVVATGAKERKPQGMFGYGEFPKVMTQLELEERLRDGSLKPERGVVFIQCAGSRVSGSGYCGKVCCSVTAENAAIIKEANPDVPVYVLYEDNRLAGAAGESALQRAKRAGVIYVKYSFENPAKVAAQNGHLTVDVENQLLGHQLRLEADAVVLACPLEAREGNEELAKMLKVPLVSTGFFFEAHVKLRPIDFATDGVFLCGTARGPVGVSEAVTQGYAAASRALNLLTHDRMCTEAIVSQIDESICRGCGICVKNCPYKAIELVKHEDRIVARVNAASCKGCGVCAAECCNGAATMAHFSGEQIIAVIDAFVEG